MSNSKTKSKATWFEIVITYFQYVLRHRRYVMVECFRFGIPVRGIFHDLSKFFPSEFMAYARYFYGQRTEQDKTNFKLAWLKHQRRNPHHWQWWLLREDDGTFIPMEMPKSVVYEMLADWYGAGKAINGKDHSWVKTWEWYRNNKHVIHLNPYTEIAVRQILMRLADIKVVDEELLVED